MKKAAAKRKSKVQNFRLDSDEPWDTFKAQVLSKIDAAIKPHAIDFDNYTFLFYITHLVPTPGMSIEDAEDHSFMIEQALKTKNPMVNIVVEEKSKGDSDKENDEESDEDKGTKKNKKKVRAFEYVALRTH